MAGKKKFYRRFQCGRNLYLRVEARCCVALVLETMQRMPGQVVVWGRPRGSGPGSGPGSVGTAGGWLGLRGAAIQGHAMLVSQLCYGPSGDPAHTHALGKTVQGQVGVGSTCSSTVPPGAGVPPYRRKPLRTGGAQPRVQDRAGAAQDPLRVANGISASLQVAGRAHESGPFRLPFLPPPPPPILWCKLASYDKAARIIVSQVFRSFSFPPPLLRFGSSV